MATPAMRREPLHSVARASNPADQPTCPTPTLVVLAELIGNVGIMCLLT